jgi:pentatricopeptide repeat domain-containing protein 1
MSLKASREWQEASTTLWWAVDHKPDLLQSLHFNIVLTTLAAAKPSEWERALMLLEQMSSVGVRPDAYSYSAAITACSRAGEAERALGVFKQCSAETDGVGPNGVVFNAMLWACKRAGPSWQPQLLALFASMGAHGLQPDAWAYSAAIDALSASGQWESAVGLITELERGSLESCSSTKPESHCYRAAMRACMRVGEARKVVELYERMVASGVAQTGHTLALALAACAKEPIALGWRRAQAMLQEPVARDALNVHSYTAAARAYASGGRWAEARALLAEMRSAHVSPNAHTYTAVISACESPRQWETAIELLDEMRTSGVHADGHALQAALQVLARAGRWEEALALVRRMASDFGVAPTAVHATTTIRALSAAERIEEADEYLREILLGGGGVVPDPRLCEVGLRVCARSGSWECALELVKGIDGAGSRRLTPAMRLHAVVSLCRSGEWERALPLLPGSARRAAPAKESGRRLDESCACHNAVLHAMCIAGEWQQAAALITEMRERGPLPDAITERLTARYAIAQRLHSDSPG